MRALLKLFPPQKHVDILVEIVGNFYEIFQRYLPLAVQIPRNRLLRNADFFEKLVQRAFPVLTLIFAVIALAGTVTVLILRAKFETKYFNSKK